MADFLVQVTKEDELMNWLKIITVLSSLHRLNGRHDISTDASCRTALSLVINIRRLRLLSEGQNYKLAGQIRF